MVLFYCSESHPLGPRAVQPSHTWDHLRGEPRGLLPDVDGGAGESGHLQHRAAQHRRSPLQMIIRRLDLVLCPVYTHRNKPMKNPTARPPSQRTRGGDEVKSESNLSTFRNFKASTFSTSNQMQNQRKSIQILRSNLITRMTVHFRKLSSKKEESARPAPVEHQHIDPQPGHDLGDQDQGDEGHAGRR